MNEHFAIPSPTLQNETENPAYPHQQKDTAPPQNNANIPLSQLMLTNRKQLIERIKNQDGLDEIIRYFVKMSLFFIILYGMCLGFYSGTVLQIFSSGIKAPMLFFGTMCICAPALYACNVLIGPQLSLKQIITLLVLKTYFISFILISAAPILLYFTATSNSYAFTSLLNIAICIVAGSCGVYMLWTEMKLFVDAHHQKMMFHLLKIWMFIYMFVGTQMAWSLRPFIGSTDIFEFLRNEPGNVYISIH